MTDVGDLVIESELIDAVRSGDEETFDRLMLRHRREIHGHCYRMMGSADEAEDLTQETFLHAWRGRTSFEGRANYRAWLYRIATNVCLDAIRKRPARAVRRPWTDGWASASPPPCEPPGLEPYLDEVRDIAAPAHEQPDAVAISRESIGFAVLTAIQLLPEKQRAVLVLREVLGWPAQATADLLGTTVAAVNSALQRARAALAENQRSAPATYSRSAQ